MSSPTFTFFDEFKHFTQQMGKKHGRMLLAQQLKFEAEVRKRELVRIATTLPCSRGVSPFRIDWSGKIKLRCPQCRQKSVEILIIYIECWTPGCNWHKKRKEFR